MRSLVHCLQANPTCRSLLSERMLAVSSVTDAIDGRPSPSKRIIGVVNDRLKMMMWAYSQRWKPSARVFWPWADLWTHPRLPRSTPTHPGSDGIKSFSTEIANWCHLSGSKAWLWRGSDRSRLSFGPFLSRDRDRRVPDIGGKCLEKHREECSWPKVWMACTTGHPYCHYANLFNSTQ